MNEEILKQAMALFDSAEKWNAFLELSYKRDLLKERWYNCLYQKIIALSNTTPNFEKWGVNRIDNWGVSWYLNDYNWNSVVIHSWAGFNVRIWLRVSEDKRKVIYELLNTDRFIPLFSCFDKIINRNNFPNEIPVDGHVAFDFQDNFVGDWLQNTLKFSWHAGNETENIANQLFQKINKFRSPEITELLIELNHKSGV